MSDMSVIFIYVSIISGLSFFGISRFAEEFDISSPWREFLILGWCIQGFVVTNLSVGHLPFMSLSLWPLYTFILLRKRFDRRGAITDTILFSLLYAHDFYSSNTYLFVMFPIAFIVLIGVFRFNGVQINYKTVIKKLTAGVSIAALITLPKVIAVASFTRNVQRSVSFVDIGIFNALNYVFTIIFMPFRLNYNQMTGWHYGNWESMNYLYPMFFLIVLLWVTCKIKKEVRVLISLLALLALGTIISSGIYAGIISKLPFIKSFHVNPRWMPIIFLGLLGVAVISIKRLNLPTWLAYVLMLISLVTPLHMLDQSYFSMNYIYRSGLDVERNRLQYCYEPVFGYGLELLPKDKIKGRYADPRCYLVKDKCTDYSLDPQLHESLESYGLKPFEH
jgi:hypothetical protein